MIAGEALGIEGLGSEDAPLTLPAQPGGRGEAGEEGLIRRVDSAWCLALVNANYPDGYDRERVANAVTTEYNSQRAPEPPRAGDAGGSLGSLLFKAPGTSLWLTLGALALIALPVVRSR